MSEPNALPELDVSKIEQNAANLWAIMNVNDMRSESARVFAQKLCRERQLLALQSKLSAFESLAAMEIPERPIGTRYCTECTDFGILVSLREAQRTYDILLAKLAVAEREKADFECKYRSIQ